MRRIFTAMTMAAVLPAMAQEHAAPRFAVFIPEHVIQTSVRAKKVFAELEVLNKNLTDKVKAKAEELQKMEQQLKSPGISDEGRAKLQRELQDGETTFKRLQEDSQAEFRKVQDKAFGTFQQEVRPIIDAVSKEWKLQVVMNFQQGLFSYADENWLVAFSAEVAKRYDAKYESGTPAAEKSAEKPAKPASKPGKK